MLCAARVNDEEVRLMLWDTAGQEEFDAITKAYYRGKRALPVSWDGGHDTWSSDKHMSSI